MSMVTNMVIFGGGDADVEDINAAMAPHVQVPEAQLGFQRVDVDASIRAPKYIEEHVYACVLNYDLDAREAAIDRFMRRTWDYPNEVVLVVSANDFERTRVYRP